MSISIEQWRAAADHVKRFDELVDLAESASDHSLITVTVRREDLDDILHEDSVRRIREFIEHEVRRELANVSEELLQRYGVKA